MEAKSIRPGEEVPKPIRLKVYRRALEIALEYQSVGGKAYYGVSGEPFLCPILPCILWGLDHILDDSPSGEPWSLFHTPHMFPELRKAFHPWTSTVAFTKPQRIEFLKQTIKTLEQDEETQTTSEV